MVLAPLSAGFQSLPLLPTIILGPSGADSRVGGLVQALGPCGSLQQTLLWGWEFFPPLQPPEVFSFRGFEALFPCAGALGCLVCFTPRCSSWFIYAWMWVCWVLPAALPAPFSATLSPTLSVYLCTNVGPQGLVVVRQPARFVSYSASVGPTMATRVLSALAAHLWPFYQSGWMFLFYLLGFRLPSSLIFCQFWLCEEVQCIYLRLHLGSLSESFLVWGILNQSWKRSDPINIWIVVFWRNFLTFRYGFYLFLCFIWEMWYEFCISKQ